MDLSWLGHACFRLRGRDVTILTDPYVDEVWGYRSELDTGTVTVHIRRLREKIENEPARPRHLETVWGVGYRLTP